MSAARGQRWLPAVAAVAVVVTACGGGSGPTWFETGPQWNGDPVPVVFEGDGYSIGSGVDVSDRRLTCAQIAIGETLLDCVHYGGGTLASGGFRVDDARFVTAHGPADVVAAVGWSSVSPNGRRLDVVAAGAGANVVWIMQPGEEPWGLQLLRADGTLFSAQSYVGLPGE